MVEYLLGMVLMGAAPPAIVNPAPCAAGRRGRNRDGSYAGMDRRHLCAKCSAAQLRGAAIYCQAFIVDTTAQHHAVHIVSPFQGLPTFEYVV